VDLNSNDSTRETYVPSKSSSSYSNKDSVVVDADGPLMNNCETLCPAGDGEQQPIGEECLDRDPKRNGVLSLAPPIGLNDEVQFLFPFIFPVPLTLHLLEIIRADLILCLLAV
jgi:hypothetical protein